MSQGPHAGVICVMRVCVYVRRDEGCGDEEELGSHAHRSLFTEVFFMLVQYHGSVIQSPMSILKYKNLDIY